MSTEILNPVSVESAIREVSNRIGKGVKIVADLYAKYLEADHSFDIAEATAFLAAEGTVEERKKRTILAVIEPRRARDKAEAEYKYAAAQARALENELRAYQSIGASIREQYRVAGVGE